MIGDPNINLTKEYLQEEGVSNSDLDDEEKQQTSVIYLFRKLFINIPRKSTDYWRVTPINCPALCENANSDNAVTTSSPDITTTSAATSSSSISARGIFDDIGSITNQEKNSPYNKHSGLWEIGENNNTTRCNDNLLR